jgi:hypothetical protein
MKKTLLIITILLGSLAYKPVDAQVRAGVNFNVGLQPIWGPTGYDRAENYYLPDIDVFYNIPNRQYIYQDRDRWVSASSLPSRYRNYDLYNGYKVVINEDRPYRNAENYRNQYARYKNNHSQEAIRNSHEEKYFENRNHPEHDKWRGNGNENENGNGKKNKENGHDNGRRGHDNK